VLHSLSTEKIKQHQQEFKVLSMLPMTIQVEKEKQNKTKPFRKYFVSPNCNHVF